MSQRVEILNTGFVTHDTQRFVTSRPEGFEFEPGQGVELALAEREDATRPFTPTSLPDDPVLEFTIKRYPDHEGVTDRLHALRTGAELSISDAFGEITWNGPGAFIAGGAGITPFLAILRSRARGELEECDLFFSNRTRKDVICEKELRDVFGDRCHLVLTRDQTDGYHSGRLDRTFLERRLPSSRRRAYVCGPPSFVDDIRSILEQRDVELVLEG